MLVGIIAATRGDGSRQDRGGLRLRQAERGNLAKGSDRHGPDRQGTGLGVGDFGDSTHGEVNLQSLTRGRNRRALPRSSPILIDPFGRRGPRQRERVRAPSDTRLTMSTVFSLAAFNAAWGLTSHTRRTFRRIEFVTFTVTAKREQHIHTSFQNRTPSIC
ncbi:MAG: hypothetical protein MZU79_03915 [Anaerotruncus sp.]|nr:hypothetical protein [Anaerotruncus sp.]